MIMLLSENNHTKKIFVLLFAIFFIVFLFTNDGHRSTFDEDIAQQQSLHIITQQPNPLYKEGESKLYFEYPTLFPYQTGPTCQNGVLCSNVFIGHSLAESPFLLLNYFINFITADTANWTLDDFTDSHYVFWRNSLEPNFTFLELFFGPFYSALSIAVFFLILRTYDVSRQNSVLMSFLFGFSTFVWAYSQTSFNVIPSTFFILLGFFLFRKFKIQNSKIYLILSSSSLGFAFLTRPDSIYFIIPIFFYSLTIFWNKEQKIKNFLAITIPLISAYLISKIIEFLRFGASTTGGLDALLSSKPNFIEGIVGILLSPGVGLLIFSPILFTIFFSFPEFYKKNKSECILFTIFVVIFSVQFGNSVYWHGLVGWGARYLYPIVPFMLIPLGIYFQSNNNKSLMIFVIFLASLGMLFNFSYVIQDVNWFVWGQMADSERGLYSLAKNHQFPLRIHPATIWTFEYSQLTHSISNLWVNLQPDIYLLKLFNIKLYFTIFFISLTPLFYYLLKFIDIGQKRIKK